MEETGTLANLSEQLADAVERAGKAIVAVNARRRLSASGLAWEGGVVVTADHVVERDDDITVSFAGGETVAATVVGRDPGTDLAVLRPASPPPATAKPAAEGSVRVGHLALAIGRPGPELAASFGIVASVGGRWRTARGGTLDGYVRADAVAFPGLSGGAVATVSGAVVGLASSHLAPGSLVAIPSSIVGRIAREILAGGRVRRAYLGVSSQPVQLPSSIRERLGDNLELGLLVMWVEPGSPAERAGLLMGDVLVSVGGRGLQSFDDLQRSLTPETIGKEVKVVVVRGGERREVVVQPGERAVDQTGRRQWTRPDRPNRPRR